MTRDWLPFDNDKPFFRPLMTDFLSETFPTGNLPRPTGSFKVGTKTTDLKDENRAEIYGEADQRIRKIKYQIWYPADEVEEGKQTKWLKDGTLLGRSLVKNALLPLPTVILDQAAALNSHAYYDAKLSNKKEKYPMVILSHGWKSFSELHTDFAEDLASHGYIVVTIDHSYGAQAVRFNDGSVIHLDKEALPRIARPSEFSKASQQLAMTYGEDIGMVLDELERLNQESKRFKGRLDLEKIAHLGHSTGGAGGLYFALKDDRLKALVGLDAWLAPLDRNSLTAGVEIPVLFMNSEQWEKRQSRRPFDLLVNHSKNIQFIKLKDTHHIDYPLLYVFTPYLKKIGLTGPHSGEKFSIMQREFVRRFFDDHLKNKATEKDYLKQISDQYDYVELEE